MSSQAYCWSAVDRDSYAHVLDGGYILRKGCVFEKEIDIIKWTSIPTYKDINNLFYTTFVIAYV